MNLVSSLPHPQTPLKISVRDEINPVPAHASQVLEIYFNIVLPHAHWSEGLLIKIS